MKNLKGGSECKMYCKVSQRYLIKSSCKKKNMDWNIQKILIFLRLKTSVREPIQILVSSTLHLVTALLVQGQCGRNINE